MAIVNLGFISSVATFSAMLSRSQREDALRPFESHIEGEEPVIREELAAQFASLCDFGLKRLLREEGSEVKTLRVEDGYGYAEHHKDWLRLGCELMVEEEEADHAYSFLTEPTNAGIFDSRIEHATEEFLQKHLPSSMFNELSCSFYLLEKPKTPNKAPEP